MGQAIAARGLIFFDEIGHDALALGVNPLDEALRPCEEGLVGFRREAHENDMVEHGVSSLI
jgi:hypothetical protein